MNPPAALPPDDPAAEISRLIETLVATEQRLVELTAGEVDAVAGPDGRTFLLQRAQEQLRQSENTRQATILNALPAHIALLDPQGLIISVNEAWQQFGRSGGMAKQQQAEGVNYLAICDATEGPGAADAHAAADGIRAVLAGTARAFTLEYPCHSPAALGWFLMMVTPLKNAHVHGAVVMHLDITGRKLAEEATRESDERFAGAFEQAPIGVALVAPDGRWLRVNRALCEIVGYTEAELRTRTFQEITHPDDLAKDLAQVSRILAGEISSYQIEKRYLHAGGQPVSVLLNATLVRDQQGRPSYFISQIQDITERKRLESRLRRLVDSDAQGVIFWNTKGEITDANDVFLRLTGYTRADLQAGRINWVAMTPPEYAPLDQRALGQLAATGVCATYEKEWIRADGRRVPIMLGAAMFDDNPEDGVCFVLDLTDRRKAEQALQASEQRFKALFEQAAVGVVLTEVRTGRFVQINRRFCEITGRSSQELVGLTFAAITHPDDVGRDLEKLHRLAAGDVRESTWEKRYRRKDGADVWVNLTVSAMWAPGAAPDYCIVVAQDITERKLAEQILQESEAGLRFLSNLGDHTRLLTDPGQIMAVTARLLGEHLRVSRCAYADMAADGERFTILHDYTDGCASTVGDYQLSLFGSRAVATLAAGQTLVIRNVDAELLDEDGSAMFNAIGIKAIITCPLVKDGVLRALMAVHQSTPRDWQPAEITLVQEVVTRCWATIERRTAEENLRKSEQRFKALFEQAGVGVAQTDAATGRYLHVNQRFCEIVGRGSAEMLGLSFPEITHPQDVGYSLEMTRRLQSGAIREYTEEKRYVQPGRPDVWATVTVSAMWAAGEKPDFFIVIAHEITKRKLLEEQLRQAHKLEAIGTFAGGIAHDFNNILAAIGGYTELARMKLQGNPGVRANLDAVVQAVQRAADLVRQILTFSRDRPIARQLIPLQPVVSECVKLLGANMPATIELELVVAPDAPTVFADESQVHQILMNLGTNARHALEGRSGRIEVKVERCLVDWTYAATHSQLRPGLYARVSVSDTGCGMSAETQRRIFEPFFTTKGPGKGTGLGLAVVHGIMNSHDGVITVYSQPGEGTVFHLYFPAHVAEAALPAKGEAPALPGHGGRVLVVDDEAVLADLGEKSLSALGYRVVSTRDPVAALAMVQADPQRFDLIITDQSMPGMTGLQLAAEIRLIRPDLPIILTTGYSLTLTPERLKAAGIQQLLLKPTSIQSLGAAAQAALSGQPLTTHVSNPPY